VKSVAFMRARNLADCRDTASGDAVQETAMSESPPSAASKSQQDQRFATVYAELMRLARRQRGPGDTLNTTGIVHELYLRLANANIGSIQDERQFLGYAARAMRNLLIDRARSRLSEKSGGGQAAVSLDDPHAAAISVDAREALALDDALRQLEREDPRAAEALELNYFAGQTTERIAEVLGVTRRTVERDLQFARAYLKASCAE
jgi:RNA polymerase sigma factor (TIGR02999 family)